MPIKKTSSGYKCMPTGKTYKTKAAAIANAADHAAFVALFDAPVDADGVPIGNPPIHNWPENTIQEYER